MWKLKPALEPHQTKLSAGMGYILPAGRGLFTFTLNQRGAHQTATPTRINYPRFGLQQDSKTFGDSARSGPLC